MISPHQDDKPASGSGPVSLEKYSRHNQNQTCEGRCVDPFSDDQMEKQQRYEGGEKYEVTDEGSRACQPKGLQPQNKGQTHLKKPNVDGSQPTRQGRNPNPFGENKGDKGLDEAEKHIQADLHHLVPLVLYIEDPEQRPKDGGAQGHCDTQRVRESHGPQLSPRCNENHP